MLGEAAEKLSTQSDPVRWIERNFYIPETRDDSVLRGRISLEQYQRDVLREAHARDENGLYKYSVVVWSDVKKSAKSTIAAAVNLYRAVNNEWSEHYIIANDLKQADSRVAHYLRRAIQLSPNLKSKSSVRGYRTTLPSNSYIEAIPIDPSGEAGSNADMLTWSELWGSNEEAKQRMFCLDDKTEVLTLNGWKPGVELEYMDEIAVYDNGNVTWEHPRYIFNEWFSGNMDVYEHKNFSLWCTRGHRLFGRYSYSGTKPEKDKYSHFGIVTSESLRNSAYSYYHPVLTVKNVERNFTQPAGVLIEATNKNHREKFIPWDQWAEFMGLYLTEGSTSDYRGVPCSVRVSQLRAPHPEKYDQIRAILENIFGDWVKIDKHDGFGIYNTKLSAILKKFGTTWQKRIPREIIESQRSVLEKFMHSYILGDGSKPTEAGSIHITCATKGMADDLQEICVRLGWRSSVRPHDKKYWRISISRGSFSVSVHKDSWTEKPYSGKVWCPTVSTGLFIARREGRVFVTGNSEMTLSPTKFGKSQRWIESYAGFSDESKLLWSLYEMGVKQGHLLWPDKLYPVTGGEPTPLELYVNENARMLCLWNTQPRCAWQTKAYYASEQAILPPNEFLRMHRNQWVSSTETFLPMAWFDACQRSQAEWPSYEPKRHPHIIAMDAAISDDTFGLVMGCRHPEKKDEVLVIYSQKWQPKPGQKIDFIGTEENPGPELVLRRLVKEYNIIQVCYDPYQLHSMSMRLKQEGLAWFKEFNQGNDRLLADSQLRDLVRDRRFWHKGEPDMREHFQNADAKIDSEDHKIRIVKRVEHLKVDLAVSASMCSYELLRLNL